MPQFSFKCQSTINVRQFLVCNRRARVLRPSTRLWAPDSVAKHRQSVGAGQRREAPPVAVSNMAYRQAETYAYILVTRIQSVVRLHVIQS